MAETADAPGEMPRPLFGVMARPDVLFRSGPAQWLRCVRQAARHKAWTGSEGFPVADGWYEATTTWREIIKAAIEAAATSPHAGTTPAAASCLPWYPPAKWPPA
ncbi:hypothetical protein TUSST3_37890 [Streptomyces sp. TUS-ST3]|nr:hypothetical protein TUSST3_37890 [Streptomyces sp. TUS-ST3]